MKVSIFLGPTLPLATASQILPATYLPPVEQGDILRALDRGTDVIGIVDGYFELAPAVWHKEILLALEAGIRVFGAASMGAIRAAELHAYGMIGVGRVFEWLRDGVIVRDDEVAVVHAREDRGYRSYSDALVDIRDACQAAVNEGVISSNDASAIQRAAEEMAYPDRSYASAAHAARLNNERSTAWQNFCKERGPGLKARDAVALLRTVAESIHKREKPPSFGKVERTTFIDQLRFEIQRADLGDSRLEEIGDEGETALRQAILLRLLGRQAADGFGWKLDAEEVSLAASRLCQRIGISNSAELEDWMSSHSVTNDAFWRFINDGLLVAKMSRLYERQINEEMVSHLRVAAATGS